MPTTFMLVPDSRHKTKAALAAFLKMLLCLSSSFFVLLSNHGGSLWLSKDLQAFFLLCGLQLRKRKCVQEFSAFPPPPLGSSIPSFRKGKPGRRFWQSYDL